MKRHGRVAAWGNCLRAAAKSLVVLGVVLAVGAARAGESSGGKPLNLVLILADDLGWADTTLYGATKLYETPNLERLAARGMTFNRAYSASPLCSPTRASILTGLTPARHGITRPDCHLDSVRMKPQLAPSAPPGSKALGVTSATRLDTKHPTLGKLMKAAGYATGHFGKWHLGPEPYSPLEHGYDVDFPHTPGPGPGKGGYLAPWSFPNFKEKFSEEHIEDRMAEEAIAWMRSNREARPFYLNYWQFSVHSPFEAKPGLVARYQAKIQALPPSPQNSPTYAAMVHSLDEAVGRLLDEIDRSGAADRTAIVFFSDNGGNMYSTVDKTVPTSNAPLRGGKATVFEGGIRVPCVIAWPGITNAGTRSEALIQSTDLYPTILGLLGIPLPEGYAIDGENFTPALRGQAWTRQRPIITYFPAATAVPDWLPPSAAIHEGDWKLIRLFHEGEGGAHRHLLYNLKEDIGETRDLSSLQPERIAELDGKLEAYLRGARAVVPAPNPAFDPAQYRPEKIGVPALGKP